jgi:predicted TPR repeat methyltransferase
MSRSTFLGGGALRYSLICLSSTAIATLLSTYRYRVIDSIMTSTALTLLYFCMALTLAQSIIPTPPHILEAILICREKLEMDPYYPRIQHSLAQLLDSTISDVGDVDTSSIHEVVQLYHAVGQPSTQVPEKRLPPAKIRFESLVRAGTIVKDILHDKSKAIEYYSLALNLDGIEESSLLLVFQTIMPTLLSLVNKDDHHVEVAMDHDCGTMASDSSARHQQMLKYAFDLCNVVEAKCPTAAIVDEYRGATFRKMNQLELAYQSYRRAVLKSKQIFDGASNKSLALAAGLVRSAILAAAAAREAGHDYQQQMSFLNDAEQAALSLLLSMDEDQEINEHSKDHFRDIIADLYSNMGIAEKKQGSLKHAQDFFMKSLEIKPTDGHALVQLASVSDTNNVGDVVSSARELEPEYVSALFDGYSSRFETELVDVLHYKGHSLLYESLRKALKRIGKSPASVKNIIDLGCGTGLLGALISNEMPWVEISGVDLSQRMVEISRERKNTRGSNVYASVSNDDAAKYLSILERRSIDCVLASDVFIYIGDISKVIKETSECLISGGIIGFTVESYGGSNKDNGLRLLPSGRFGHSRRYINKVAKLNGFEIFSWEHCVLRRQGETNVRGSSVILRKLQ